MSTITQENIDIQVPFIDGNLKAYKAWEIVWSFYESFRRETGRCLVDFDTTADLFLASISSNNNRVLLDSYSGCGKTVFANIVKNLMGSLSYQRLQGTPDVSPATIVGSEMPVVMNDNTVRLLPIAGKLEEKELLLFDEINRYPQRTQSALLEAFEECQVTYGHVTKQLWENLIVIATLNPKDLSSTCQLIRAVRDRFTIVINPGEPIGETRTLVRKGLNKNGQKLIKPGDLSSILNGSKDQKVGDASQSVEDLLSQMHPDHLFSLLEKILDHTVVLSDEQGFVIDQIDGGLNGHPLESAEMDRIRDVIDSSSRLENGPIEKGPSVRFTSTVSLWLKAYALVKGRVRVEWEDLLEIPKLCAHRIIIRPEAVPYGMTEDSFSRDLVTKVVRAALDDRV